MKLSIEPTERSIWRMTMMRTMPVLITAMAEVCTSKIQRLRDVRNTPSPVRHWPKIWKPIQMRTSAPIMPRRRVSVSVARKKRCTGLSCAIMCPDLASATLAMRPSPLCLSSLADQTPGEDIREPRGPCGAARSIMQIGAGFATGGALEGSAAALDRAGLDAGASLVLADPAGVDHVAEIVLGDRVWGQQDGVHLHAFLA